MDVVECIEHGPSRRNLCLQAPCIIVEDAATSGFFIGRPSPAATLGAMNVKRCESPKAGPSGDWKRSVRGICKHSDTLRGVL